MRVIDAFTGRDVKVGNTIPSPDGGTWKLLHVEDAGLWMASALIERNQDVRRVPLAVRFMHPDFLFQRVAFVNS